MRLPELEQPERYAGLYVFDFGEQVAIGYTADEIAVLLESAKYADGKVYRIHRALPDGTMELQGVARERFQAEDGLFFYRRDLESARQDLADLERLVTEAPPPCRMKAHMARRPDEPEQYMVAMIFPAEFTHDVAGWLNRADYRGGDYVEGGVSQVTGYYAMQPTVIERRQFWPAKNLSRPPEEVLASTHLVVQRKTA